MNKKNKLKYFKYKKKYLELKSMVGGGKKKKKITKKKRIKKKSKGGSSNNKILQSTFNTYIQINNDSVSMHFEKKILNILIFLIINIARYVIDNKINTIIGIGDSPSMILGIFMEYFKNSSYYKNNKDFNIKYFPISKLRTVDPKDLKDKLSDLENKIGKKSLKNDILWIDYVNSGLGITNFHLSLSKKLFAKSKFFLYGVPLSEDYFFSALLEKHKKRMVYYNFEFESIINTLFAQVFGDSESFNIRCVEYSDVTQNNFKIKLYDNIPTKNSKLNKECENMYKFIYDRCLKFNMLPEIS